MNTLRNPGGRKTTKPKAKRPAPKLPIMSESFRDLAAALEYLQVLKQDMWSRSVTGEDELAMAVSDRIIVEMRRRVGLEDIELT